MTKKIIFLIYFFLLINSSYLFVNAQSNIVVKVENEIINLFYKQYSKAIPVIGKYITGSSKPYDYLIKSIDQFYSQDQVVELLKKNGFSNVEYRNLSSGISAIYSGWKI